MQRSPYLQTLKSEVEGAGNVVMHVLWCPGNVVMPSQQPSTSNGMQSSGFVHVLFYIPCTTQKPQQLQQSPHTWISHAPSYVAEWFLEAVPVHYSDLVWLNTQGACPRVGKVRGHFPDSIAITLVPNKDDWHLLSSTLMTNLLYSTCNNTSLFRMDIFCRIETTNSNEALEVIS